MDNMGVRGANRLHSQKSQYNLELVLHIHGSSVSVVLHPGIQLTSDHVVLYYVFTEKNPCLSGPVQFKPMLVKGQLYFIFVFCLLLRTTRGQW